jgi:hypothetical protein
MDIRFYIRAGDQPVIKDTLTAGGTDTAINLAAPKDPPDATPINLTGSTVQLLAQGPGSGNNFSAPATLVDPPNGLVQVQLTALQTAVPGQYAAEWQIVDMNGIVTTARPFRFEIRPLLPVPQVSQFGLLSDLYDDVRALTGDFDRRLYDDSAICSVMRTVLRRGAVRVEDDCRCQTWAVGPDGISIVPAIQTTDAYPYALLLYHSALQLVAPNMAAYSYRTRALSERWGEHRDFMGELKNTLYELENGEGIAGSINGLRASLFAVNGVWVWSYLQTENAIDLSFH